jgi:heme/copper-type cytochrome/quinol oxidase subunit 3
MLYVIAFVAQFTIGGLSGVHFATVPIDWHTHDSYYVVAHFRYVLGGGTLFGILAATYYRFPKITGRLLDERLGKIGFWLTFFGFNLTFFLMHILGLMGQPRRTWTYPDLPGWGTLNLVATIGAYILAVGVVVLVWNMVQALRHGQVAGDNPWDAWTLEWATTSPPPPYNFAVLPPIASARPLWDVHHPRAMAAGVEAGGGNVVRSVVPQPARPWLLERWPAPIVGMLAFIFSEATFFGCLIAAYIEYRYRSPSGPSPHDLDVPRTAIFSVCLFASSATIYLAERRLHRGDERGFRWWWLATIVLGAVFLVGQLTEYATQYREGITIGDNVFTSAYFTLTGFHGLHVTVGLIMLISLLGLAFAGDFAHGRRRTLLNVVSIYWHFVDAVWVVVFSIVYLWTLFG